MRYNPGSKAYKNTYNVQKKRSVEDFDVANKGLDTTNSFTDAIPHMDEEYTPLVDEESWDVWRDGLNAGKYVDEHAWNHQLALYIFCKLN